MIRMQMKRITSKCSAFVISNESQVIVSMTAVELVKAYSLHLQWRLSKLLRKCSLCSCNFFAKDEPTFFLPIESLWYSSNLLSFASDYINFSLLSPSSRRIANTENYKLTNLYPDTLYYIWLAARSQRGEGATTPPIPVRTKQYGKHSQFHAHSPWNIRVSFCDSFCVRFPFRLRLSFHRKNILRTTFLLLETLLFGAVVFFGRCRIFFRIRLLTLIDFCDMLAANSTFGIILKLFSTILPSASVVEEFVDYSCKKKLTAICFLFLRMIPDALEVFGVKHIYHKISRMVREKLSNRYSDCNWCRRFL